MLSKALVTSVYQKKLEELAKLPDIELVAVVPPFWIEGRVGRLDLERRFVDGYDLVVEPMRMNGNHHLHWYPGLGKQMRRFRPEIVHIDEEPYNFVTAHALWHARRAGAKGLFFAFQNIYRRYPPPFSMFERWAFRTAAAGIAGNHDALDVLRRKGFRGNGVVIPQFGVDPDIYRPLREPGEAPPSVIAYYGRLVPEKGVDTLLDALVLLPEQVRAIIVGSGNALGDLRAQCERLGLRARVEFRGPIPAEQIPEFLAGVAAVVIPSRTRPNWKEQFGRVIIEAMACGVPVVGSDSGEIPNVIGDAGLVFPEGDAAGLAGALERVLSEPSLALQLAVTGRERILARYTQQSVARETWELYQRVLAADAGMKEV